MAYPIQIGLARSADATQIAAMSRDLIEHGLGWSWTRERVARSMRCADTVVLVARGAERVVGFSIMYFGRDEAHLNLLAVRPGYRRLGIARQLVSWLEESALVAGVSLIYLEVRANNAAAQAFYRRLGYRRIQVVPGYYSGVETAVRMARDLWCDVTPSRT